MPETVRGYCPACKQEVDYEVDQELGGQTFCSICGRTQEAAEKAENLLRKQIASKRFWLTMKVVVGVVVGVIILVLLGIVLLIDPERIIDKAVGTATGMVLLAIPVAIIAAVLPLLKRRKKK